MYTTCETSRLNPEVHSHLFLYDFRVMMLEHPGLNGRKASDWLRLCCAAGGRFSSQVVCSDNLNDTHFEYVYSVNGTGFPQSSEGNHLTSKYSKENSKILKLQIRKIRCSNIKYKYFPPTEMGYEHLT